MAVRTGGRGDFMLVLNAAVTGIVIGSEG